MSCKRRRNLPSSLLSASLYLAILHQSLLVLICLFSVDRLSAITVRGLSSVVGIIVQHLNEIPQCVFKTSLCSTKLHAMAH